MKLYIVFAQQKCSYEGQYAPEALAIVDEYCHDENPDWIEGELAKASANKGYVSAAIISVNLGDAAVALIQDRLTGTTAVKGEVAPGLH